MTVFRMIALMIILLFKPLSAQAGVHPIHYIGIGQDCQIAGALIQHSLRNAAYPLDWMVSTHFDGVIDAFQTDFKHFLNPAFLVHKGDHIENTYYQFGYNHFFPVVGHPVTEEVHVAGTIVPNFLDYLPFVKEVQTRRIKRLLNLLTSKDKIVFIRTHINQHQAADFMNMIKHKYPKKKIFLVVAHEREDLQGDWHLPDVINFYVCQKSGFANWWSTEEWSRIFTGVHAWLTSKGIK